MMKDPYANYVIQKILQKCTSDQREVLLGLIRNHLTTLKKYSYGKHIIAQFEQLCNEGDLFFFRIFLSILTIKLFISSILCSV